VVDDSNMPSNHTGGRVDASGRRSWSWPARALLPYRQGRVLDVVVYLLILVIVAAGVVHALTASVPAATFRISDDAYYYFNVARNVITGKGVTFDGINATNGFHPLWMLCVLPIFGVFAGDPEIALRAALVLVTLVAGAAFAVAYGCLRAHAGRAAAVVGLAAMCAPLCLNPLLNGLETGLLLVLLFATLWACGRYNLLAPTASPRGTIVLAVLLSLVFLCRLDSVFIIFAVLLVTGCRRRATVLPAMPSRPWWAVYTRLALVAAALAGPYFLWNFAHFGRLTPISGALKSTFPTPSLSLSRLLSPHLLLAGAELVFAGLMLAWLVRPADPAVPARPSIASAPATALKADRPSYDMLVAMWIGCVLHFVYSAVFMRWGVQWWHFAAYVPVTLTLGVLAFARLHARLRQRVWVSVATCVLVLTGSLGALHVDAQRRGAHHDPWYAAALWARRHLPAEAVVGMTDCGLFGYFCNRPTVNLDGVINGYEYQRALRDGKLSSYLRRCGVTHVADYETRYAKDEHVIRLPARLYQAPGGSIVASPPAEVYRSQPYADAVHPEGGIRFVIWDLTGVRVVDRAVPSRDTLAQGRP